MFPPPSQITVGGYNPITLLILYYFSYMLVTLLKEIDASVQVPNIFYLSVSFKFLNFSFNILFLFVREMFASLTCSYNKVRKLAAVYAMAALDKKLSMVCCRCHISVSQLCCC
jgi:hypothetical protein